MVELSQNTKTLLSVCATAMSNRQNSSLEMSSLKEDFLQPGGCKAILGHLASEVERLSQGHLTVRQADPALIADKVMGPCLYLGVCPEDTEVTDVTPNVSLYMLAPFSNGFSIARPASAAAVAEYRKQLSRL